MILPTRSTAQGPRPGTTDTSGAATSPADVRTSEKRASVDLLAMVSHELLTPLTIIAASADTLARDDMQLEAGMQQRLLAHVREESDRLGVLLQQLVTASRLQAGRVRVHTRELRSDHLLRRAAGHAMRGRETPICLVIDIHTAPVLADPQLALDVLIRLIERAASQPGVTSIEAGCRRDDTGVRFWVHDDGPTIPPSEQARAFDRFSTTAGDGPGVPTGIGLRLHICRQLVQLMGGSIRLESREHVGTTFHVQLPAASPNHRTRLTFPQPQQQQDGTHARDDRAQQPA